MYQYQVTFSEAIQRAFNNYSNFTGRASRSEYWWFYLFGVLVSWGCSLIGVITFGSDSAFNGLFSGLWALAILLPSLGLGVRRLHDTGRSGWNLCWAFLPIIGTINDLRSSGDRILRIEAVLSGTLNYIFNTLSADVPFSETVRLAKEMGYSEPDPRIDLSGTDVIRKLVILTREGGYRAEQDEVERNLFVPADIMNGTLEEFWSRLPELDADFEARRKVLEAEGKRWRFVARMELGRMSVGLEAVDSRHPFYDLEGSNNIILLTTERYREYPMLIQGYGAGAAVTAAGVFANIISTANN